MLTSQELAQINAFLNRTQLSGNEAPTLVSLMQKISVVGKATAAKEQEAAAIANKVE